MSPLLLPPLAVYLFVFVGLSSVSRQMIDYVRRCLFLVETGTLRRWLFTGYRLEPFMFLLIVLWPVAFAYAVCVGAYSTKES